MTKQNSAIQSLIFDKKLFNQYQAIEWLYTHGFHITKPVDERVRSYRYRQYPPSRFKYFRTIELTDGIKAVVGFY